MNFFYLPIKGKPKLMEGNPFEFIKKMGMKIVVDYFNWFSDSKYIFKDRMTLNWGFNRGDYSYYLLIFNNDGKNFLDDDGKVNMNASTFINAYNRKYVGNYVEIRSNAILVKLNEETKELSEFSKEEINHIWGMIDDAREWIPLYM